MKKTIKSEKNECAITSSAELMGDKNKQHFSTLCGVVQDTGNTYIFDLNFIFCPYCGKKLKKR